MMDSALDSSTSIYVDTDIVKRMDSDDDSFDQSERGSLISKKSLKLDDSSRKNKKKTNEKMKKSIAKSLKNSVILKQGEEKLGANEEDGINNAF